jgi:hypothetical protein
MASSICVDLKVELVVEAAYHSEEILAFLIRLNILRCMVEAVEMDANKLLEESL